MTSVELATKLSPGPHYPQGHVLGLQAWGRGQVKRLLLPLAKDPDADITSAGYSATR